MLELILRVVFVLALAAMGSDAGAVTTGAPAPKSAPAARSEADAYLAQVRPILVQLGEGGDRMAGLMAAPALSDPQWREDADAAFDAIQAAHVALLEVEPAPSMAEAHAAMTAGTEKCSQGAKEAQEAVGSDSVLGLYAAAQLFQACGEGIAEANEMIDAAKK